MLVLRLLFELELELELLLGMGLKPPTGFPGVPGRFCGRPEIFPAKIRKHTAVKAPEVFIILDES